MTKATDIVGYTYQADSFCPRCIVDETGGDSADFEAEHWLDLIVQGTGIDRQDERSFDSSDHPKVIFASCVVPHEACGRCHELLRNVLPAPRRHYNH